MYLMASQNTAVDNTANGKSTIFTSEMKWSLVKYSEVAENRKVKYKFPQICT